MTGVPRSQRLFAYHFTAAGISAVWQCPDDFVTLVKSAAFSSTAAVAANVLLTIQTPPPNIIVRAFITLIEPNTAVEWTGWHVLNPGDVTYVYCDQPDVVCWVSGAVLAGAPQFAPATRQLPVQQPNG